MTVLRMGRRGSGKEVPLTDRLSTKRRPLAWTWAFTTPSAPCPDLVRASTPSFLIGRLAKTWVPTDRVRPRGAAGGPSEKFNQGARFCCRRAAHETDEPLPMQFMIGNGSGPGELAVFVAAVADQLHQVAGFRDNGLDHRPIVGVERKAEHPGILGDVLRYAEPGADNHACDRRPVQDVANADIGDTDAMFVGDVLENGEQFLEQYPSAPGVDHVFVLLQ